MTAHLMQSQMPLKPDFPVPPMAHTTFLGRQRELEEICALVREPGARLVTLAGPGGVGKTRIGLEVARRLAAEFDGRIVYIPLSASGSDQQVLDLIARAVGMAETRDAVHPSAIAAAIDLQPVLLLLDNFEHLLDQAAMLGRLMAAESHLKLLVTSRAALEIRGERVYLVDPFPLPANVGQLSLGDLVKLDVLRLFEERARAVQHDFRINESNAAVIAAICQRLDGLPLAVELAAARTRLIAPAVLLARLDRPLENLGPGPRDSPGRHQSLRAALDWSYDLLPRDEQRLFRRLGAPRGSFSMAAIEILMRGIALDPLDSLSSLVSKSLVQPDSAVQTDGVESVRFQLLATVREFALEKLQEHDELAEAHDLFAQCIEYLANAVAPDISLGRSHDDLSFDIAGADREPTLAVLEWLLRSGQHTRHLRLVGALAPHWFARGALRDAHTSLEIALAHSDAGDPADVARATVASGMVAIQQGKFIFGEARLSAGIASARISGSDEWIGQAIFSLGVVEQDQGRPQAAIPLFQSACDAFEDGGRPIFAAVARNNLGLVTARALDPREGLAIIEQARLRHQELGFPFGVALTNRYAGQVLLGLGERQGARQALRESLQLNPSMMQGWHIANAIETLAQIDALEGKYRQAAVLAEGASSIREKIGVPLEPALIEAWNDFRAQLRAQLNERELAQATAEGHALDQAELIALAISGAGGHEPLNVAPCTPAPSDANETLNAITAREREVLELLVLGKTNPEIAEVLFISPRTVSVHVTHILEKLSAENRSAAVALALKAGLVVLPESQLGQARGSSQKRRD